MRINKDITAEAVRVLDAEENDLGIMLLGEALYRAERMRVDLVEVGPDAIPPVCQLKRYRPEQG